MSLPAAITGIGPVSAIGTGVEQFWSALVEGRSGIGSLSRIAPPRRGCSVAAEVRDPAAHPLDPIRPMPRAVELALAAARLAWDDARPTAAPERIGVVVGTGLGNLDLIEATLAAATRGERLSPVVASAPSPTRPPSRSRVSSTCADRWRPSRAAATRAWTRGLALDWLRLGRADVVVVGGTEAELTPTFLSAMTAARALAVRHNDTPASAMRSFDLARDGNVPGEGAGFLVLESLEEAGRRRARGRALLEGFACTSVGQREPYDPFKPVFNPAPMVRAMRCALSDAGFSPDQISAISANGSSSVFYDEVEAVSIAALWGAKGPPVHSIKSVLGQTGAVIPALQAIAAALSIGHGLIPPTMNVPDLDPRCPIDLVRDQARPAELRHVLANAIGFGGFYNASLLIGGA